MLSDMLAAQRRELILEELQRAGAVRVAALTRQLGVSDMTVRRDLDVLARRGLLQKVHGGATLAPSSSSEEPGFEAKWLHRQREKEAIARTAASLVGPGDAVGLSAGTTAWTLAHELREIPDLTVVTNSIQVAEVLYSGTARQTVVLAGGVRTPSDALVGPVTISALRQLHLDVVFLGVHGMDPDRGFTTPNLMEADVDRAFVDAAQRLVVIADHTKWGVVGISSIAPLERADVLVTDVGLPRPAVEVLEGRIASVLQVGIGDGPNGPDGSNGSDGLDGSDKERNP